MRSSVLHKITAGALCALIGTSCAVDPESNSDDDSIRVSGSDCFRSGSVADYKPLDDDLMVVWSPSRSCAYLVGMSLGCSRLRFASSIAFSDRDGRICGDPDDRIVTGGSFPDDCRVTAVEKMTPERLLLILPEAAKENSDGEISNCGRTLNN